MADQKISAMPSAATLTGAELVPLVQDGVNVQTDIGTLDTFFQGAYGAWHSSVTQTGSISSGTVMTFNIQDVSDSVTLVDNSKFTVPTAGIYNLQFSSQFKNTANTQNDVTIWVRVNGLDLDASGGQVTIPARKSNNIYGYGLPAWNYYLDLNANDYVEIVWLPVSTLVTMEALPASVSPAYPSIPSVIASISRV